MTWVRALLGVCAAAGALVGLAWLLQDRLIYLPSGSPGTPADAGLPTGEVVTYTTDDGLELTAWFVPADTPPGATVLVFPGNAGNRAARAPLAAGLAREGLSVLLVEYRGYGGNPGRPSEAGLLRDARAAHGYVTGRPDVDGDRLVYFGESLGGGVAVGLAAQRPPAALVLRSPFASLAEIGRLHYPFLPVDRLLRDRFEVARTITRYAGPVLVVAGTDDTIVPPEASERVAAAAPGPTRFEPIPGGHNDAALGSGPGLVGPVTAFLADHLGAGGG